MRLSDRLARWRSDIDRVDRTVPLPPGAEVDLREDNPRLIELREAYEALQWPVVRHSRWSREGLEGWLDLRWFRGETHYIYNYRDTPRFTDFRYFIYQQYIEQLDSAGLLGRLEEDGAFGCFTFTFAGRERSSRDLLDSVNELYFLDQHLGILGGSGIRTLDIGAGYGRLAHRAVVANPRLADWCCVDAVAPSTFLSEWYLAYRGAAPQARVVALNEVPELDDQFDLACNVHSFSECTLDAIEWWVEQLVRLNVPTLFLVPNEPSGFLSTEVDNRRLDYLPVLQAGGYHLEVDQPAIADPAVRELFGVDDRHCLLRRQ